MNEICWQNVMGLIITTMIFVDYLLIESFDLVGTFLVVIAVIFLINIKKES